MSQAAIEQQMKHLTNRWHSECVGSAGDESVANQVKALASQCLKNGSVMAFGEEIKLNTAIASLVAQGVTLIGAKACSIVLNELSAMIELAYYEAEAA